MMLKHKNEYMAPEGADGGFEVSESPTEQIEFVITPDGMTDAERTAASTPATPALDPNVAAMIEAMKTRAEATSTAPANPPAQEGLAEVLAKMNQTLEAANAPKQQQVTLESLTAEIKDLWYTDPVKANMKMLEFYENTRLGPAVNALQAKINAQEAEISGLKVQGEKAGLTGNARAKFATEKYSSEVETLAATYKGQPGAYLRAAQEVSLRHDDEYMENWLATRTVKGQTPVNNGAPPVVGQAPTGQAGGRRQVAWTPQMEQDRLERGIDQETYLWSIENGHIADPRKARK